MVPGSLPEPIWPQDTRLCCDPFDFGPLFGPPRGPKIVPKLPQRRPKQSQQGFKVEKNVFKSNMQQTFVFDKVFSHIFGIFVEFW